MLRRLLPSPGHCMVTDEEWEGLAVEGRIVHCVDLCGVLAYLCAPLEITVYMYMSVPSPLSWGRSSFTGFSPPICVCTCFYYNTCFMQCSTAVNCNTVYVENFAVDLFLHVQAPTVKLKTTNVLFSNPHTSTSPITGAALS